MRKPSYRWTTIVILIFLTLDIYFQWKVSPVPLWQSKWFMWRALVLLVILFVILLYKAYEHFKSVEIEKQDIINKFIRQQDEGFRKIASELHDSLGQNLIILNNDIIKFSNSYPADSVEFAELNKINVLLTESVDELRNISSQIYPHKIEKLGLKKSIESMAENAFTSSGINLNLSVGEIDRFFNKDIELNIYRIIQECINNILKHSKATEVSINVHFASGGLTGEITDNGEGFDLRQEKENPGFGLKNIRYRTIFSGGSIKIDSKPNNGTKIKFIIPLRA
jgi:two-component system, sensor histidine kinase LadS